MRLHNRILQLSLCTGLVASAVLGQAPYPTVDIRLSEEGKAVYFDVHDAALGERIMLALHVSVGGSSAEETTMRGLAEAAVAEPNEDPQAFAAALVGVIYEPLTMPPNPLPFDVPSETVVETLAAFSTVWSTWGFQGATTRLTQGVPAAVSGPTLLEWEVEPSGFVGGPLIPWTTLGYGVENAFGHEEVLREVLADQYTREGTQQVFPHSNEVDLIISQIVGGVEYNLNAVAMSVADPGNGTKPQVRITGTRTVPIVLPDDPGGNRMFRFPFGDGTQYEYPGAPEVSFMVESFFPIPAGANLHMLVPTTTGFTLILTETFEEYFASCQLPSNTVSGPAGLVFMPSGLPMPLAAPNVIATNTFQLTRIYLP